MNKEKVFTFIYRGVAHDAYSIGDSFLPDLKDIISVHALPLTDDNKIVVVNVRSRGIDMMGGHVEPNETSALETLNREVDEEAQLTIKDCVLVDVLEIRSELIKENDRKYIVLYTAHIDKINEFIANDEISERLTLSIDIFAEKYFGNAPEYIKTLYHLALQKF
jgi:8-oxo-dGTP pyrophosphatase MutT (NUDIX family)